MNEKIKNYLIQYNKSKGWKTDDESLIETIIDAKQIFREEVSKSRWWNEYRYVVEIGDMLIGYIDAEANRDESVWELGYEFDPSTICEMMWKKKTITVYIPVKE